MLATSRSTVVRSSGSTARLYVVAKMLMSLPRRLLFVSMKIRIKRSARMNCMFAPIGTPIALATMSMYEGRTAAQPQRAVLKHRINGGKNACGDRKGAARRQQHLAWASGRHMACNGPDGVG